MVWLPAGRREVIATATVGYLVAEAIGDTVRRLIPTIAAILLGLTLTVPMPADGATPSFSDVPRAQPFYGDIEWLASQGITRGNSDGSFGPTTSVSRQAMAAFLYRFAHSGADAAPCTAAPFPDVAVSNPFCGDIAWMRSAGISQGSTDGRYLTAAPVSRQAMAAFMYRLVNHGATAPTCARSPFPDVSPASPFCGAISWLVDQGVTNGFADGDYHPLDAVAREAMAAFLHRLSRPAPAVSSGHYVRTTKLALLQAAGRADAQADQGSSGHHLHLLDIGAQSVSSPLSSANPGVALAGTCLKSGGPCIRLTYPQLLTLLEGYLDGLSSADTANTVVAVGTNSDGCFAQCQTGSNYSAATKGSDWWTYVIAPLRAYAAKAGSDVSIVAANDIEPGFAATPTQVRQWKSSLLAAASNDGAIGLELVDNGSADGCPVGYDEPGRSCNRGWTEAQLASLAGGPHTEALPQIYNSAQPIQWANIALTAGGSVTFLGSLTENGADAGGSQTPDRGWIALWNAFTAAGTSTVLPYSCDLDIIQ